MHWILQADFDAEPGWPRLVRSLERFSLPHSIHDLSVPSRALRPEPSISHRNVICFGSYSLRHVAKRFGWSPGVFDLVDCDFVRQRFHWHEHLLNADSVVCSLDEARFPERSMFVRPVADTKTFNGRVFTRESFDSWRAVVCDAEKGGNLGPETLVQVAPLRTIYAEYRFWVVRGQVVTSSLYKRGGRVFSSDAVDGRVREFVEHRVSEWSPHDAFVIDVCETERGMAIVELNTLNSAAFYAADVQALVLSLEDAFDGSEPRDGR